MSIVLDASTARFLRPHERVTVTTMLACGSGVPTVYGVFQAWLFGSGQSRYWDYNDADSELVGRVVVERGSADPDYLALAQRFETPDAPAFSF